MMSLNVFNSRKTKDASRSLQARSFAAITALDKPLLRPRATFAGTVALMVVAFGIKVVQASEPAGLVTPQECAPQANGLAGERDESDQGKGGGAKKSANQSVSKKTFHLALSPREANWLNYESMQYIAPEIMKRDQAFLTPDSLSPTLGFFAVNTLGFVFLKKLSGFLDQDTWTGRLYGGSQAAVTRFLAALKQQITGIFPQVRAVGQGVGPYREQLLQGVKYSAAMWFGLQAAPRRTGMEEMVMLPRSRVDLGRIRTAIFAMQVHADLACESVGAQNALLDRGVNIFHREFSEKDFQEGRVYLDGRQISLQELQKEMPAPPYRLHVFDSKIRCRRGFLSSASLPLLIAQKQAALEEAGEQAGEQAGLRRVSSSVKRFFRKLSDGWIGG